MDNNIPWDNMKIGISNNTLTNTKINIDWDPNNYTITGNAIATISTTYPMSASIGPLQPSLNAKYSVMNLPRKKTPIAVFASGRMLTLGLLGTCVECAYTSEQIIFSPGTINALTFNGKVTVSVEYEDEILHYNIGDEIGNHYESDTSSTLIVMLVSTIRKKGAISGAK